MYAISIVTGSRPVRLKSSLLENSAFIQQHMAGNLTFIDLGFPHRPD